MEFLITRGRPPGTPLSHQHAFIVKRTSYLEFLITRGGPPGPLVIKSFRYEVLFTMKACWWERGVPGGLPLVIKSPRYEVLFAMKACWWERGVPAGSPPGYQKLQGPLASKGEDAYV